jgi:hypothetical protein
MLTRPNTTMPRLKLVETSQYPSAKGECDSVAATPAIGRLCAGAWFVVRFVVRQVADILFNRVKTGAGAAAAASVDWPDYCRPIELDLRFASLSRSYWLMRRHGIIDFNKIGGLTLHSPEALADYIAAVSKSAQADVGATRLFPANSNSRGT